MGKHYRTKFPVVSLFLCLGSNTFAIRKARVKRIMRLDGEVGKVSRVTPILISKALECFMQTLILETCEQVRLSGSKKLMMCHLKAAIVSSHKFDFLKDFVDAVPDQQAPKELVPG